ncbi:MAG TPA: methyltransferase domain-containing protein [Thermoanaerobaculia bacterium]|nr:methyltransferase domain-containing protein [Thermoanaerobaculia bacterium]
MSIGFGRALRIVHRAFRGYPARHRLHILIRFLTCPFTRTLDVIPVGARVLEIGAGHGVYALLISTGRAREVVAVDPDLRKMLLPTPSPRIRKVAGYENCIRGTFDAIVFYDTLYLIEVPDRPALFASLYARLVPGGTLVLKDMDPSDRFKTSWARTQEELNTRFLHITTGSGFVHQTKEEVAALLEAAGFVDFHARSVGRGYPHPHMLYTARRP